MVDRVKHHRAVRSTAQPGTQSEPPVLAPPHRTPCGDSTPRSPAHLVGLSSCGAMGHVALGVGAVRPAGLRHHPQQVARSTHSGARMAWPSAIGAPPGAPGDAVSMLQFCRSWAENSRYGAVLGGPLRIRIDPIEGGCGHLRTARQGVRFPQAHHLAEFKLYGGDLQIQLLSVATVAITVAIHASIGF